MNQKLNKSWAHAPQLLKPMCLRACAPQEKEANTPQLESSPHSQQEEAPTQQQRPSTAKNK